MKPTIVRKIARPDGDAVRTLQQLGVATVHEAQGRTGLAKPYLRPAWTPARAAGSAVTVLAHPGDNWMLHVAVELCGAGDMLVRASTRKSTK